jgi:transposase InsO family protein
MAGSKYFTLLDIENAYWNIPIKEEDKDKTGFVTPFGTYRYERMAFGLSGAPSTFQRVMDAMLVGLRDVDVLVYLDDLLIFSETIEEHVRRMRLVFDRIRQANFKLNVDKCTFAVPEVAYLGHVVNKNGVAPDPGKVFVIKNFPKPRTVKEVRSFLGLSGYYRAFIQNYAAMSRPLTQLTKKDVPFVWSENQQQSFEKLKAALTSQSVLAHPRFDQPFILSTDASDYAISAILSQLHGGKERPISFASRMLNAAERNYSTTEKELLAVVFGTQIHRCFLYGRKFKIVTDHAALKWLITVKNHQCARLTRWVLKLAEYEFSVEHKAGQQHVNADCLSRHIPVATVARDRTPLDEKLNIELSRENVFTAQQSDGYCKEMRKKMRIGEDCECVISKDGLMYVRSDGDRTKLIVPQKLVRQVIEAHHDRVVAGHQGVKRTRDLIKLDYFWPSMNRDIECYVKQCESCAKFKSGRQPTAPLGELPETHFPFELVSIDICGPYPETRRGNRYLLTFIDHFSRYPEAIPIPKQDASTVARALVTEIFSRLGCPQTISSDRGTNFMSELFQEMCKLLNIKRINSTAFNPKMQGKVEKFHLGLNQTMSHYVNKYGNDWDEFVNYALMAHRAIPHSITRFSPYYLLHGRQMKLPMEDDLTMAEYPVKRDSRTPLQDHIDTLADRLKEAYRITRENNNLGRRRQKAQYDKGTKLITFQPGDEVYLREMVRRKRGCPKFRVKWKGPFTVIKRLSDLNYLVKVKRNKEIVVNVNKMKHCHQGRSPLTPRSQGLSRSETDVSVEEERLPISSSYDSDENRGGTITPTVETDAEDRRNLPDAEREGRVTEENRETKTKYWLRRRPTDLGTARNDNADSVLAQEATANDAADSVPLTHSLANDMQGPRVSEATGHEQAVGSRVEVGQEQIGNEEHQVPRYDFRPLPGRKIAKLWNRS